MEGELQAGIEVCCPMSCICIAHLSAQAAMAEKHGAFLLQDAESGVASASALPHPHAVTWNQQLASDSLGKDTLAGQPSSANKSAYTARQSVSMYMEDTSASMKFEDAGTTMKIVSALRERCVQTINLANTYSKTVFCSCAAVAIWQTYTTKLCEPCN